MSARSSLQLIQAFDYADIYFVKEEPILVVEAVTTYIPIDEFKIVFDKVQQVAQEQSIHKVIFDKRKLTVFHQPSMEWYFTEWKEAVYDLGIKVHRKILPEDFSFRQSAKIGQIRIREKYPELRTSRMDIQYVESLEEAIRH